MGDKQLRDAVRFVVNGTAKMGEVCYGDDGVDMAQDIARIIRERDRYKRALGRIAKAYDGDERMGLLEMVRVAISALDVK